MSSSQNIPQYLRQTYGELAKAEKVGDYERCLKACSKILKHTPNDVVALQCKAITLVHLQKFDEAISVIKRNSTLSRTCIFEKAYCEYRLNLNEDAIKTLHSSAEAVDDFRCRELLAQLHYRCERYEESYEQYVDLLKNSEDDLDDLRRTNLAAAAAQLARSSPQNTHKYVPSQSIYEQYYNEGCRLCFVGKFEEALKQLDKAEELCRKSLAENDAPEDEIEDEICCIKLQKAYCQQMLGKTDDALSVYLEVSKKKPSDVSLAAVAANNTVSLRKEANLFDARKKMKSCQGPLLQQKLNTFQKEVICYNGLLINLHSNQLEVCRKNVDELRTVFKAHELALLCEAALLVRQKEAGSAINFVENYIKDNSTACSKVVYYTLVQLYLNENMVNQAINALQTFDLVPTSKGMLSLLVALCLLSEDKQASIKTLSATIDRLQKTQDKDAVVPILLEECASIYLSINDYVTAAKYLEDLRKFKSNEASVLARLVNIYLIFDTGKAEQLCKSLPDLNHLTRDIDVDSLENAEFLLLGGKYGSKKAARADVASPKIDDTDLIAHKKKRKKKRKIKLPKKIDPNVPPDPERWLPKFERSTYKKRKDKRARDRDVGRGTQGAVSGVGDYDSSAKPDAPTSPASPKPGSATATPGPRQQRPLAQKPKKKKKGGR